MTHQEPRPDRPLGVSLNAMIFLSLLFHVLLLSFLMIPRSFSTPKWTFGPVYSVQLVSMPAEFSTRKETGLSYKELMKNDASDLALLKKGAIRRESFDALSSAPIATVKMKQKPVSDIEHALEAIRKNIQRPVSPSAPNAASRGSERVASQASSSPPGRAGDAELNTRMNAYYRQIWARIKGMWSLPQGILPKGSIEAVIHAQIMHDGTIVNTSFERRSGNRYFDESAMRAVKRSAPLPPLPEALGGGSIEVGIRFHSSELR